MAKKHECKVVRWGQRACVQCKRSLSQESDGSAPTSYGGMDVSVMCEMNVSCVSISNVMLV